jgi:PAS domain-containing protein
MSFENQSLNKLSEAKNITTTIISAVSSRRLPNNATLALFIMDERQQCVFMNPAAEKLSGYTFEEARGKALHYVVHHTRPDGSHYPLENVRLTVFFRKITGNRVRKSSFIRTARFIRSPLPPARFVKTEKPSARLSRFAASRRKKSLKPRLNLQPKKRKDFCLPSVNRDWKASFCFASGR